MAIIRKGNVLGEGGLLALLPKNAFKVRSWSAGYSEASRAKTYEACTKNGLTLEPIFDKCDGKEMLYLAFVYSNNGIYENRRLCLEAFRALVNRGSR